MSGGIAYVLDEDNDLYTRMNKEMVFSEEISNKYDVMELKDMIKEHVALTNSEKGKAILDNFSEYLPKFKKVIPYDYNRMLMAIVQMEEKGLSSEQAQIEAFYANTRGALRKMFLRQVPQGITMEDMSNGKTNWIYRLRERRCESDRAEGAHQKF